MEYQAVRELLLAFPEAEEDFPFYPDVAVMKVRGKMFATLAVEDEIPRMNLKADPDKALMWRDFYTAVTPGYHMNKKHWNTVLLDSSVSENDIQQMIRDSYCLVVKGLKKADRDSLKLLHAEFDFTEI